MRGRRAEIEAAGARLVFVGNGSVAHARRFREKHVPESEVYTDPELTAYTALGFNGALERLRRRAAVHAGKLM